MATLTAFAYQGRNAEGKLVKGSLDAPSEAAATSRLRAMGVTPVSITESGKGTGLQREVSIPGFEKRVKLQDLAVMSRQMATMVGAGLPLLRVLGILAEQAGSAELRKIMGQVRDEVEEGTALSVAMGRHPRDFPPLMISMVRAGETGGFLDGALESIAENFEKEVKLNSTIKSAMTYPVVVLIISLIAVVIMLVFIVPIFKDMFEGLGGALPGPTQALVVLSQNMIWIGPVALVLIVSGWLWWRSNKNKESVRRRIDPIKLKVPVFGALAQKIALARFARNFSNMIGAGVPILQSLKIVGETSGNWVIQNALDDVADSVRRGESIARPLAMQPVFPPMVTQMMAVGEDAGSLETMLKKIAMFYDQEVEAMTESLTSLIEPILIAFLGVIVGGMIVALYLPIFNIATLVQ